MVTGSAYPDMETGRATAILREGAGTQWDARVVEAMLAVLAATPERVPLYQVLAGAPVPGAARTAAVPAA